MKDAPYFSHDYNARSDEKTKLLIRKHGMLGYGAYWAIVEDLYNNANALRTDCEGIAYDLRVEETSVKSIINDFDLFVIDGDTFGSLSVERRLNERAAKSKSASKSAILRWEKHKENANALQTDANALQPESDRNAIKDRKEIKERIEKKERIEIKENITPSFDFLIENNISSHDAFEFISSEFWFGTKAMQLKSEVDILIEKAKEFLIDVRDRDMLEGKSLIDLRSHFVSWFKLKQKSENTTSKQNYLTPEFTDIK